MKTLEVTSSLVANRSRTPSAEPAHTNVALTPESGMFDGVTWSYRAGFDQVLGRLNSAAWADPHGSNWRCVKENSTRAVWCAELDGREYFLKYYFDHRWTDRLKAWLREPAGQAEWRCGLTALQAGIPAVPPAGYTPRLRALGRWCAVLVTESVAPAWPLNDFWATLRTDGDAQRRRVDTAHLIEVLAELIARSHQAGFEHTDMHAENILVQRTGTRQYRAVFVDLHSARLDTQVTDQAVLRNLAQLNQWFRRHASIADRLRFLRAYLRWRGEFEHAFAHGRALAASFREIVPALARTAERHAERLTAQRDRRVFRDGRYFGRLKLGAGWRAHVHLACKRPLVESRASSLTLTRDWWRSQLADPLAWFSDGAATNCKDSHSAAVRRTTLRLSDETLLPVIIKRPLSRNRWRLLRMLVPPSRSARGWQMGHALLHRNQPTARPLAVLERRIGPLILDSVLITEALPGAVDLERHIRIGVDADAPEVWFRHKRELARQLAKLMRAFTARGFSHRDCKAGNVLVSALPELRLAWIDMDGVRGPARPAGTLPWRALTRLYVSVRDLPGLTRGDFARFLAEYCRRFGSGTDIWRTTWREIEHRAARQEARRAARRTWKFKHYGRE